MTKHPSLSGFVRNYLSSHSSGGGSPKSAWREDPVPSEVTERDLSQASLLPPAVPWPDAA